MKLYATIKNNRQGKKGTGDDTRIITELSYKNKVVCTIGLYAIIDDKKEGYRVVWDDGRGYKDNRILVEEENVKS